ncbi:MAG: phytanoyl-CoA dioxygenase family protein [Pseudomonadota bacterium]
MAISIDPERIREYQTQGYTLLPGALPPEMLQRLREECAYFVGYTDARMQAKGVETEFITHRGKRYFISGQYRKSRYLPEFLFGDLMASVARAFAGDEAYLFVEQWVVKGAEEGMKFAWHQDAGYVVSLDPKNDPPPYITCWIALDDMSDANGTISVLPHERVGTAGRVLPHTREPGSNDMIGYTGDDPGEPIECPAGSIAVFSSTTLHRSSANTSNALRRAYLAQYSVAPVYASSGQQWAFAMPFLRGGENVYDPANDKGAEGALLFSRDS